MFRFTLRLFFVGKIKGLFIKIDIYLSSLNIILCCLNIIQMSIE